MLVAGTKSIKCVGINIYIINLLSLILFFVFLPNLLYIFSQFPFLFSFLSIFRISNGVLKSKAMFDSHKMLGKGKIIM